MHHRTISRQPLLTAALIVVTFSGPASAQTFGQPINVEILNPAATDRPVEVIDNICETQVLEQRIAAGAEVAVRLCTLAMGGGDATVRDTLTGQEARYRDLLDGAQIRVP